MTLSSRVGGPLASIRAETTSLLQLFRMWPVKMEGVSDCWLLLTAWFRLISWASDELSSTTNFLTKGVVHFGAPSRQWSGDHEFESHTGWLLNERADEYAGLRCSAEGLELWSETQKYSIVMAASQTHRTGLRTTEQKTTAQRFSSKLIRYSLSTQVVQPTSVAPSLWWTFCIA